MKKLSFFILLTLINNAYGQWSQIASGTTAELTAVHFLNKDTGIVGGGGVIRRTINGGADWTTSYSGNIYVEDIIFPTPLTGYAAGADFSINKAMVLKTTNGGTSWNTIQLDTNIFLKGVNFISDELGFIVGGNGFIGKTTDGGISWSYLSSGTTESLQKVFFTDSLNGIVVGGLLNSAILRTSDGGQTWGTVSHSSTEFLQSVYFPSQSIGYIVGWGGEIMKTTDGGVNWQHQTSVPSSGGNLSVFFISDNEGYIVGGDMGKAVIQKTINGGQTWFGQSTDVQYGLVDVHFPDSQVGYAVGENGTIFKTTNGGGVAVQEQLSDHIDLQLFPNPATNYIKIKNSNDVAILRIIDFAGNIVKQNSDFDNFIDIAEMPTGQYLVEITFKSTKKVHRKFIKL